MSSVSQTRRRVARALPLAPAPLRTQDPRHGQKVLRYAFRVARTGFDPARVNDRYPGAASIFNALPTYEHLARPARVVPDTALACPEKFSGIIEASLFRPFVVALRRHPCARDCRKCGDIDTALRSRTAA
jgi:hypothetical protein